MNTYQIHFSYAGQEQTIEKVAASERKARCMLYDQIGDSHRLEIIRITKIS